MARREAFPAHAAIPVLDTQQFRGLLSAVNTDAPYLPESVLGGRSRPESQCHKKFLVSAAAASTFARAILFETFRLCRPCGSSHKWRDLREGSRPDRGLCRYASAADRTRGACSPACLGRVCRLS